MKPIEEVWEFCKYNVLDNTLCDFMENWLQTNYPEAKWTVTIDHFMPHISIEFNNPKEETFYRLKWA